MKAEQARIDHGFELRPACPSCGGERPLSLGDSCFTDWAETEIVASLRSFSGGLYKCTQCRLVFRWPVPTPPQLALAYQNIPLACWTYKRQGYWRSISAYIRALAPNDNVLDVGCFRGDFLDTLSPRFSRYGVEPNAQAASVAVSRGVKIIGRFAEEELEGYDGFFGAIVMMDVIEHVHDPKATLLRLKRYLSPGGIIILLTGNSDHWLARRSLPFYYYMSFPIHLVYLSRSYVDWLCGATGFARVGWKTVAHEYGGLRRRLAEGKLGISVLLRRQWCAGRPIGRILEGAGVLRPVPMRTPPNLFSLRDHFVAVLKLA